VLNPRPSLVGRFRPANDFQAISPSPIIAARPSIAKDPHGDPLVPILVGTNINQVLARLILIEKAEAPPSVGKRPRPRNHAPVRQPVMERFQTIDVAVPLAVDQHEIIRGLGDILDRFGLLRRHANVDNPISIRLQRLLPPIPAA